MNFCKRYRKEGGKEYLGRLHLVFPTKISWTGIKSPVQLAAKVAVICGLSSTPFMGMFFAPWKLNVYFPILTYDRGAWSMLMIKDGGISCSETNAGMFL